MARAIAQLVLLQQAVRQPVKCALFSGSWDCGGGGCFLAGTQVLTSQGLKPIQLISPGDQVLSRSRDGKDERWVTASETCKGLRVGYYLINGHTSVTKDHPFWVDGAWKTVDKLKIGDDLVDRNGSTVTVATLEYRDKVVRAHNIDVISPDTFFAEGVLVHNKAIPVIK